MLVSQNILHPLEILTKIIVLKYFNVSYCTTFILESNSYNIIPNELETSINLIKIDSPQVLEDLMFSVYDMGCSDYVVQIQNPEVFIDSLAALSQRANTRRTNRKIIILPLLNSTIPNDSINSILNGNKLEHLPNTLLILPSESNKFSPCKTYDILTNNFLAKNSVFIQLDNWNSCTEKFQNNANLLPFDITDLKGKTVTVSTFTYKPYVILDLDQSIPFGRDGTEVRILEEFCSWVNCTIKILREDEAEWGEIYENGTGVGILADVYLNRADIAIAAVYYWYDLYQFIDYTSYCLRSGVTAIVPVPRLLVSWMLPLLPFDWSMWLVLASTFIFSSFAVYAALQFRSNKVFFTTFSIMISQSQNELSYRRWAFRSVSGWLLVTSLIIDNAYSSGLASIFTVPLYETSIDTIQDLVDRRMTWGAPHDAWVYSITTSKEPKIKQLVKQFKSLDPRELSELSFGRSMAYSVERLGGGNFAIGDYITDKAAANLEIMLEDFYYEFTNLVVRKNSPYKDKINKLILRLQESGLLYAWEQQVVLNYLDYKVQNQIKLSRTQSEADVEPLNLKGVVGIFIIYVVGIVLATLIFICELTFRKH